MKEKLFETTVILRPDGGMDSVRQFADRVNGIVEAMSGKIVSFQSWGEKKLAYEIKKNLKGHYVYFDYVGTGALVAELERNFNNWEYVLKFMSCRVNKKVDLAKIKAEAKGVTTLSERVSEWRQHDERSEHSPSAKTESSPLSVDDNYEYNSKLRESLDKSKESETEDVDL